MMFLYLNYENGKSLLSVNTPTVFEMEYVWTKEETFVTLFLLLHHAVLLAKKVVLIEFIFKGDQYIPSNEQLY